MNRHRVILLLAAVALLVGPTAGQDERPGDAPRPVATVPAYRQANKVAVLVVEGVIDRMTLQSLERRVADALEDGADAIVLDIDTPGGDALATLDICHLIKTDCPDNTVAWINSAAYSAGTIMALACREIVVSPNSRMGDAAPIQGSPVTGLAPLPTAERAKIESPILAEVLDSARRNHYDENLVQAFISVGVELWLLENVESGDRVFVDRTEYTRVFGEAPPEQITSLKPAATATPVAPWVDQSIPRGGLEPPDPADVREAAELALDRPPVRAPLTEADRGRWRLVTQITSDERLLTLNEHEAIHFGLARVTIANDEELRTYFGAATVTRYEETWSEDLVRFLISWPVRAILIVIFLLCLFVEMAAPGVGIFGLASLAALVVLLGAPLLAGMASWWEVLLIVAGLALIMLEVFVVPGFGVAGISGIVCLLVGLVGTFVSGDVTTTQGQGELWTGLGATLTALLASMIGIWIVSRYVQTVPLFDRFVLKSEVGQGNQAVHGGRGGLLEAMAGPGRTGLALGDEGTTLTDLGPSGRADFGGEVFDVRSAGRFIDRGRTVRVVSVGTLIIEVEEA